MRRVAAFFGVLLAVLAVLLSGLWGGAALFFSGPGGELLRQVLAGAFALAVLLTIPGLWLPRWRWRSLGSYSLLFIVLLGWWMTVTPSNDRDWQPDVSKLPYATVNGDRIKFHNVRNFDYRSEFDYAPAWYDKEYDLSKLEGVDIIAVYWMGPAIAHVFVSFEFAGGEHLAVSIETRKEKSEAYSTVKGFFRQYELYYVVADERDVIRLRTNYRKDPPEDVYVYRLRGGSLDTARSFFMDYVKKINALKDQPEFYNTLTTNCTTNIWFHARVNPAHLPFNWKILASGYVPEYLYQHGLFGTDRTFEELQRAAYVNPRAQAADKAMDFASRIRKAGDVAATK